MAATNCLAAKRFASSLSSYNQYSPAASIDWGVSLSAIWGRYKYVSVAVFLKNDYASSLECPL
jgi:hypothetical protein